MKYKKQIFKIQVSRLTNDPTASEYGMTLIYNKDRTVLGQWGTTAREVELMRGRPKAYFFGKVNDQDRVEIFNEAPYQGW